jgi:hypothetical protein
VTNVASVEEALRTDFSIVTVAVMRECGDGVSVVVLVKNNDPSNVGQVFQVAGVLSEVTP